MAHLEAGVLLGDPWDPAGLLSRPGRPWVDVNVSVRLQFVADLTRVSEQRLLETTVQELTGDWRGYHQRRGDASVPEPVGRAPTQLLGEALHDVPLLEGFLSVSARVPDRRNLNVFPQKLQKGSRIIFEYAERDLRLEIKPRRKRQRTGRRQPTRG